MITWIAGWPHCGSTLLRQILLQSFDIPSGSLYPEPQLNFLFGEEPVKFAENWQRDKLRAYIYCTSDRGMWYLKTHEIAIDNERAIFLVRDGRDAVSALSHFWQIPIRSVITGQCCTFGGWSDYYWAWDPKNRPKTLIVRFEDMVEKPQEVVYELERFLGQASVRPFEDKFDENKQEWSQLFFDKNACWQDRLTEFDLELFWKCHGPAMKELGYGREGVERQVLESGAE